MLWGWKAAGLGQSPAAMFSSPAASTSPCSGLLLTDFPSVTFSGASSEMKEEMKDLRSRVEALEQVSCSTSLCPARPAPTRGCLQPGFPSSPALFLTSQQRSQLRSPQPPAAPTPRLFQPFEHNRSPLSPPWWVLHPPGGPAGRGGCTHSSPSPCRSSSWCWPPSTT